MAALTDQQREALTGIVRSAMADKDPGGLLDVLVDSIAEQAGGGVDGLLALADHLARPDKLSTPQGFPQLAGLLKDGHRERVGAEARARFEPRTPREALLAIRKVAAEVHIDTDPSDLSTLVDRYAEQGLRGTGPSFEWADQLTEYLARAVAVLELLVGEEGERRIAKGDLDQIADKAAEALALPPDIEAAIDVRRSR